MAGTASQNSEERGHEHGLGLRPVERIVVPPDQYPDEQHQARPCADVESRLCSNTPHDTPDPPRHRDHERHNDPEPDQPGLGQDLDVGVVYLRSGAGRRHELIVDAGAVTGEQLGSQLRRPELLEPRWKPTPTIGCSLNRRNPASARIKRWTVVLLPNPDDHGRFVGRRKATAARPTSTMNSNRIGVRNSRASRSTSPNPHLLQPVDPERQHGRRGAPVRPRHEQSHGSDQQHREPHPATPRYGAVDGQDQDQCRQQAGLVGAVRARESRRDGPSARLRSSPRPTRR